MRAVSTIVSRTQIVASVLVFISAICFAAKAVIVRLAYRFDIDTVSMLALRMLFSLPFFVAIAWGAHRKAVAQGHPLMRLRDVLQIAGLGLLGYYLASFLDFLGLRYISAGLERLILFVYPTLVVVFSWLLFKNRISTAQGWALGLTYVGIAIAFLEHLLHSGQRHFWLGTAFVFLSAVVFAFYLIGGSNVIPRWGTWRFTSLAMIAASIAVLIHYGLTKPWSQLWRFPPELYGLILIMAVFSTVLPSFLVAEGLRVIGSGNTSIISSFSPVATIMLANVFLGEQFGVWQWLGTFLVIGGVLLTTLQRS